MDGVILYCQKLFLYFEQMAYSPERVKLSARINIFLTTFYVPLWLKSSNGSKAAINDMSFIQCILKFEIIDALIVTAALQKVLKHSWLSGRRDVNYTLFFDNFDEKHKN